MARFGFGAAALLERRPDLLVVSSSANGSTGPDALAAGLASIFGATGGLSEQTGYRRRSTDGDRRVDRLPQRERDGGRDPRRAAPPRADRAVASTSTSRRARSSSPARRTRSWRTSSVSTGTLASGTRTARCSPTTSTPARVTDDWVAIAVGDDEEWAALCGVLDRDEWVARYPTAEATARGGRRDRRRHHARGRAGDRRREAFETLQARRRARRWPGHDERGAGDRSAPARHAACSSTSSTPRSGGRASCARRGSSPTSTARSRARTAHRPGQRLRTRDAPRTLSGRARPTSGGAPLTTTGSGELRIGLVGGGDARRTSALEEADRLAVGRRARRVAQPEPRGDDGPRPARRTHRAGKGRHVDPAPAALSTGARGEADRRSRPRHQRARDPGRRRSAASTRRSSARARSRSRSAAAAPTR